MRAWLILVPLAVLGCAEGDASSVGGGAARDDAAGPDAFSPDASSDASGPTSDAAADGDADADATIADADAGPLPYPTRTAFRIKGIQPDFWPKRDDISGNGAGGVAMNLVWSAWEPAPKTAPCDAAKEQEHDGRCFVIDAAVDEAIADWTKRGLVVTAVVYGVPAWARIATGCSPAAPGFEIFCAPKDPSDYARYAGMLARRYDGRSGHGRIADFVIHNEVNANDWFDVGCGAGTACDTNAWIDAYASNWSSAYDAIAKAQPTAKVLISLDHHFGKTFDQPAAARPLLSGETFLARFASKVSPRPWRVAFHPYPPDLLKPQFGPQDYPRVTYGNLGVLAGFLRRTFPTVPSAHEIQLTESGVSSLAPNSTEDAQADGVCRSFVNVLGTPGIESYVYHRLVDHPDETKAGLGVGLFDTSKTAKKAWATWALANRVDLSPPQVSCGFEDLPYARLRRSYASGKGHWASTRLPPAGFVVESSVRIWREPVGSLLWECQVGTHGMLSKDPGCEGQVNLGPVGWVKDAAGSGLAALHRCRTNDGTDHFVSLASDCEGHVTEHVLGWVVP